MDFDLDGARSKATSSRATGAGTWAVIHLAGKDADENYDNYDHFMWLVQLIASTYKSEDCRNHFADFLAKYPPQRGLAFAWTIDAHNAVNRRQGRHELTLSEAEAVWGKDNVSILSCSEEAPVQEPTVTQARTSQARLAPGGGRLDGFGIRLPVADASTTPYAPMPYVMSIGNYYSMVSSMVKR